MINTEVFKGIQYNSITELCAELARFSNKTNDSSSLPKLELLLISGSILTGKIIDYQKNNTQSSILVDVSNEIKQVTFIPVQNLVAISILDLDRFLLLQETENTLQTIGKLEFKRNILEVESRLTDILKKNITIQIENSEVIGEKERINANIILEQLPSLFESISCDNISERLLNDSVNSIQLVFSNSQLIQLNEGMLTICIREKRMHTISKEVEILKKEIESLL